LVANYGIHELTDETAAQIAAIELARSIRQERAELLGQHYSVSVTDEFGELPALVYYFYNFSDRRSGSDMFSSGLSMHSHLRIFH
jgi:hypothetical protein